jgi:lipoprotein-releasing system permease protein
MSYERFIGLRYLMAKKRSQFVSIITLISIVGVALGVTALIVVLSVMGGFKADLKQKILGTKAHAVVEAADGDDLADAAQVADRVMGFDGVTGAEPFLEAEVMVSSPTNLSGVILRGIDPERVGQVSELTESITDGKLAYLHDPQPLLEELERERQMDADEIFERIERERGDFEREKSKQKGEGADRDDGGADAGSSTEDAEAADEDGAPEAIMPPIVEEDAEDEESDEADESDVMPPIFGEEEGDEDEADDDDAGDYERLPGLAIGPELAKSLQVELGGEVNVVTPEGDMGPTGMMPRSRPFRVVAIFETGMYEYDANYAYTSFSDAKSFLNRDGASGVEVKTVDASQAVEIAKNLADQLGPQYRVLDWQEMNRSLFFALELEKIAMFVVLTFIILVASFSIVAMLIMIVIEKARDIAVLKSMGVTNRGVRRIFEFQGLVIGGVGTLLGVVLGLGICLYLSMYGVPLDSDVYYITTLPVDVNPWEVGAVVVCAMFISWLATVYPAYLASKLKPVDGLRYE